MTPARGDLVVVQYHDLQGSANGDPDDADLAHGEKFAGWWWGYRTRGGKRQLVCCSVKSADGRLSGWHSWPVSTVDSVRAIRRKS